MSVYETVLKILLETGPVVSLFKFCEQYSLPYDWTRQIIHRAARNQHITVTRVGDQRGQPARMALTSSGRMYARSLPERLGMQQ